MRESDQHHSEECPIQQRSDMWEHSDAVHSHNHRCEANTLYTEIGWALLTEEEKRLLVRHAIACALLREKKKDQATTREQKGV